MQNAEDSDIKKTKSKPELISLTNSFFDPKKIIWEDNIHLRLY